MLKFDDSHLQFEGYTAPKPNMIDYGVSETEDATETNIVSVVLVSSHDRDLAQLEYVMQSTNWTLRRAHDYGEAAALFRKWPPSVIITEPRLRGGHSWKDLLYDPNVTDSGARVIVTATGQDDSLWSEVLNLGGYDVLVKPFDRAEVVRVVSLAWLSWREERQQRRGLHLLPSVQSGMSRGSTKVSALHALD